MSLPNIGHSARNSLTQKGVIPRLIHMAAWWTRREPAKDDLRTLARRVDDLEADMRRLKAEWVDMYEKLVRRDERLRKREERAGQSQLDLIPAPATKAALWARLKLQRGSNGAP